MGSSCGGGAGALAPDVTTEAHDPILHQPEDHLYDQLKQA